MIKIFLHSIVRMTKKVAKVQNCGQNISSTVEMTKKVAKVHKCGQNISSTLGITKKVAKVYKCGQKYANLLYRNYISRGSPENYYVI